MTTYLKDGKTMDYKPASDVKCGDLVVVGDIVCLARWDIPANTSGTLKILQKGEVVHVKTETALGAIAANGKVYVTSAGAVTTTGTNNKPLGQVAAAVGESNTEFDVVCL